MDGHPGNKEIGDTLFTSFPYNHMLYGHWLDKVCCMNPDPRGQVVVEVDTVGGTGPLGNGSGDYTQKVSATVYTCP